MDNRKILPVVVILALFIILCGILFRFLVMDTKNYYTIINNADVVAAASENKIKYKYTLDSYDKNGNERKLTFKSSNLLKEGTYLKLKASLTRGVIKYSKVKYKNLPNKVKDKY